MPKRAGPDNDLDEAQRQRRHDAVLIEVWVAVKARQRQLRYAGKGGPRTFSIPATCRELCKDGDFAVGVAVLSESALAALDLGKLRFRKRPEQPRVLRRFDADYLEDQFYHIDPIIRRYERWRSREFRHASAVDKVIAAHADMFLEELHRRVDEVSGLTADGKPLVKRAKKNAMGWTLPRSERKQ